MSEGFCKLYLILISIMAVMSPWVWIYATSLYQGGYGGVSDVAKICIIAFPICFMSGVYWGWKQYHLGNYKMAYKYSLLITAAPILVYIALGG